MAAADLHINDLPDSLLLMIFSHLDQVDLHLSVSRVCKRWESLSYDKELWRHFNQWDYLQNFCGLVETGGFQFYVLQRVHSYIKHITFSVEGLVLLPFLEKIPMPRLQSMTLPVWHKDLAKSANCEGLATIRKIHKSTGALMYSGRKRYYASSIDNTPFIEIKFPWNECVCMEYTQQTLVTGMDTSTVLSNDNDYVDSTLLGECFETNCKYKSILIDAFTHTIPSAIFKELTTLECLQDLDIRGYVERLEDLTENELDHLCKNLVSLKSLKHLSPLRPTDHTNLGKIISHTHSLRCLGLYSGSVPWLSVVSLTCKQLTELFLYQITELTDPKNSNLLCDIARHCTELRRMSLSHIHGNIMNSFLQILSQNCRQVNYLDLEAVTYCHPRIEKNTMIQLFLCCPLLKTLKSSRYIIDGCVPVNSLKDFEGTICLEELSIFVLKSSGLSSLTAELEALGKMLNLTVLQLVSHDGVFVFIETVQTINKICPNLTDLTLDECNKYRVQVPLEAYNNFDTEAQDDKGGEILAQLNLQKLKKLYLGLMCKCLQTEDVQKLMDRSIYLMELTLAPICDDSIRDLETKLGTRPHKLRCTGLKTSKTMKLTMLSQTTYKQLAAPEWAICSK